MIYNKRKPTKIIDYKGQRFYLYKSSYFFKTLGKTYQTATKLEKKGFLPKPYFKSGRWRLYNQYEIQALFYCSTTFGVPSRFSKFVEKSKFLVNLKNLFAYIHECIDKGETPDMPVKLEFKNENELRIFIKNILMQFNISGDLTIDNVKDAFLRYRVYI